MNEYLPIHIEKKDFLYKKISSINENEIKDILKPFFKVPTYKECSNLYEDKWKLCQNECYRKLSKVVMKEIQSTIYYLRVLYFSILSFSKEKIEFKINTSSPLTGLWSTDYKKIELFIHSNDEKKELIFGFGPSASGKTFHVKNIISILRNISPDFPSTFISIDGGICREYSVIYQMIIKEMEIHFTGIKNLSLPSIYTTIHYYNLIFPTESIKKNIVNFLTNQKSSFNLYVPETLGSCGEKRIESCQKKINKFIKITKNKNWIGLCIWQHKYHIDCNFISKYKCRGCHESGKAREIVEGKMYSNSSWLHSYKEGVKFMLKAPSYRFFLHNSGSKNRKSILVDYSKEPILTEKNIKNKSIRVVSKNCIELKIQK